MKKKLILLFLVILCLSCEKESTFLTTDNAILDEQSLILDFDFLDREELNQNIKQIVLSKNGIAWNDLSEQDIASAFVMAQTNIVTIAYSREANRSNDKNVILNMLETLEPEGSISEEKQIVEIDDDLQLLNVRIHKPETLIKLRRMPEVESIDVYYSLLTDAQIEEGYGKIAERMEEIEKKQNELLNQQGQRSSSNLQTVDPKVGIVHQIDDYWNQGPPSMGDNIGVAVIDVGNDIDNAIFGQGGSYNSSSMANDLTMVSRYKDCWWCWWIGYESVYSDPNATFIIDWHTHGASRLSEIGNPIGNTTGVAYNADLTIVRGSLRVPIDLDPEIFDQVYGVTRSYRYLKNKSNIDIISMSMGALFEWISIKRSVKDCVNSGKLVFNAAGSFPLGILIEFALQGTIGQLTLFPARMDETIACTAINNVWGVQVHAINAFGNADFVTEHDWFFGTSSEATAYNAAMAAIIWGNEPHLTPGQVIQKMAQASDYPYHGNWRFGYGRVNMMDYLNNSNF